VLGVCVEALKETSPADEEELLNSKFVLTSGSLLPSKVEVKKPLKEDCPNELEKEEVLEYMYTTCILEVVSLYLDLKEWDGRCFL